MTKGGGGFSENANTGGSGGGGGGGSSEKTNENKKKQMGSSGRMFTAAAPDAPPQQQTMAKLPKLVYHIMKDKKLKELLVNAGLNPGGSRAAMEKRHKEFTLRVNATIDSGHQPNVSAIAREVTKLERDRDRAGLMTAAASSGLTGSAPTAAAAANSKSDTFSRLIASVKQRAQSIPKPPRKEEDDSQEVDEVEAVMDDEVPVEDANVVDDDGGGGDETNDDAENDDDDDGKRMDEDGNKNVEEEDDAAVQDSEGGWDETSTEEWRDLPLSQMPPGGLAAAAHE